MVGGDAGDVGENEGIRIDGGKVMGAGDRKGAGYGRGKREIIKDPPR